VTRNKVPLHSKVQLYSVEIRRERERERGHAVLSDVRVSTTVGRCVESDRQTDVQTDSEMSAWPVCLSS